MLEGYTVLFTYRDITQETPLFPMDNKNLICACVVLGVAPVAALTNGNKVQVTFVKKEVEPIVQLVQRFLSGIEVELPTDYGKVIRVEQMWQNLMALQESFKSQNGSARKTPMRG